MLLPQIRGVKPSMNSAKLYVSANVVDRLSRPTSSSNSHRYDEDNTRSFDINYFGDRPVIDVASFMGSLRSTAKPGNSNRQNNNNNNNYSNNNFDDITVSRDDNYSSGYRTPYNHNRQRPQSAPKERSRSNSLGGAAMSAEEVREREIQFSNFIGRQEQSVLKKERKIQEVTANIISNISFNIF